MAASLQVYVGGPTSVLQVVLAGRVVVLDAMAQNYSVLESVVQLHDKAAPLAPGDVPLYSFRVPAGRSFALTLSPPENSGRTFAAGLIVAWSTTDATYTAPAGAVGALYASGRSYP